MLPLLQYVAQYMLYDIDGTHNIIYIRLSNDIVCVARVVVG